MDANIGHKIFESFCYVIGVYVNMIGQYHSTGNLIAPYWGMAKRCRPLWFISIYSALEYVTSRVNVWKPSLLPFTNSDYRAILTQVRSSTRSCKQNPRSYSNINILSFKEIHISNLCKNKPQGTINNNPGTKL